MAGAKNAVFHEKISPFLREKMANYRADPASMPNGIGFLERQYLVDPEESGVKGLEVDRHYQSEVQTVFDGKTLRGVEKLYRRTLLVEPTNVCAAHCRWCIRGQYDTLTRSGLKEVVVE